MAREINPISHLSKQSPPDLTLLTGDAVQQLQRREGGRFLARLAVKAGEIVWRDGK